MNDKLSYAITILQKDYDLIQKALNETNAWERYPEAWERQTKKSKELKKAIEILKNKKNDTDNIT